MATAPVKSQPLHNFSLPFLKWGGKNHTNANHRFRRPLSGDSSSQPSPPPADHTSEPDSETDARHHRVGSRTSRNRFGFSSCYLADKSHNHHHHHQQQQTSNGAGNNETDDDGGERKRDAEEHAEAEAEAEAEEATVQKPWNLRPRKPAFPRGAAEIEAGGSRNGELAVAVTGGPSEPKSLRLRGMAEMQQRGGGAERKEKRKFWIALSREEIEEDIFVMTGSRPARRPKKRPKHVQKQLDSVFPGLWLVGATADAYRVADAPAKVEELRGVAACETSCIKVVATVNLTWKASLHRWEAE